MTHELDGIYQVTTTTSYQGPLEKKSDGQTEIVNGKTERRDDANCLWTSSFTVLNENEVEMVSVADASDADSDFMLTAPNGAPTREPVTYKTVLKYQRKGERIQLSGQIDYGGEVTFLTMRKS